MTPHNPHLHNNLVDVISHKGCRLIIDWVAVSVHDLDTENQTSKVGRMKSSEFVLHKCQWAILAPLRLSKGLQRVLMQVGDGDASSQL